MKTFQNYPILEVEEETKLTPKNPRHEFEYELVASLRGKRSFHCAMCENYARTVLAPQIAEARKQRKREREAAKALLASFPPLPQKTQAQKQAEDDMRQARKQALAEELAADAKRGIHVRLWIGRACDASIMRRQWWGKDDKLIMRRLRITKEELDVLEAFMRGEVGEDALRGLRKL